MSLSVSSVKLCVLSLVCQGGSSWVALHVINVLKVVWEEVVTSLPSWKGDTWKEQQHGGVYPILQLQNGNGLQQPSAKPFNQLAKHWELMVDTSIRLIHRIDFNLGIISSSEGLCLICSKCRRPKAVIKACAHCSHCNEPLLELNLSNLRLWCTEPTKPLASDWTSWNHISQPDSNRQLPVILHLDELMAQLGLP